MSCYSNNIASPEETMNFIKALLRFSAVMDMQDITCFLFLFVWIHPIAINFGVQTEIVREDLVHSSQLRATGKAWEPRQYCIYMYLSQPSLNYVNVAT